MQSVLCSFSKSRFPKAVLNQWKREFGLCNHLVIVSSISPSPLAASTLAQQSSMKIMWKWMKIKTRKWIFFVLPKFWGKCFRRRFSWVFQHKSRSRWDLLDNFQFSGNSNSVDSKVAEQNRISASKMSIGLSLKMGFDEISEILKSLE